MPATQHQLPSTYHPFGSDLEYLEQELEWVITRCRRIGIEKKLEKDKLGRDKRSHWKDRLDDPEDMRRQLSITKREEIAQRETIDARLKTTRDSGKVLALDTVVETYGLSQIERWILLLAAAPSFSSQFDDHFYLLSPDGPCASSPTVENVFAFADFSFTERIRQRKLFGLEAPLAANDLVFVDFRDRYSNPQELLSATVSINAMTLNYILGDDSLGNEFVEFSSIETPLTTLDQVVINDSDKQRILSVVQRHDEYLSYRESWGFNKTVKYGKGVLMLFHGPPGTGKTMTAHGVADKLGKRILNVDIPTFIENRSADRFLPGLFREARLQNAILFFDECETLFADRRTGNTLMTLLLTEIERFEGVAILATNIPEELDQALGRRILVKCKFVKPDRIAREAIWKKHIPEGAPLSDDVDFAALADQFDVTGGLIKNAVLVAVADAVHTYNDRVSSGEDSPNKKEIPILTQEILERATKSQMVTLSSGRSDLIQTKMSLRDVVLPDTLMESLEEIVDAARNRRSVLQRWGIGSKLSYGKGLAALFCGPSGTGKTLAAEAVAFELNRPLIRAAVPSLVSMYVGNTERNLARIFSEAKSEGAVLFLDEADSLLSSREGLNASKHDISAVNVLLQEIEAHDGVVLMATNLPESLDKALTRRLSYQLHFPLPSATLRERIYEKLLPQSVPTEGPLELWSLANRFELSGGQIKNVVFRAAFKAARAERGLCAEDLVRAAEVESDDRIGGSGRCIRKAGF